MHWYKHHKTQEKINHQLYKDDIKLFTKREKQLETLLQEVRIYCEDLGMEFGIEKRAMFKRKIVKTQMTEGIKLPNQEKIRAIEEIETYKYLWIFMKREKELETLLQEVRIYCEDIGTEKHK